MSGKVISLILKLFGAAFLFLTPIVYIIKFGKLPASDEAVGLWIIAVGIGAMALPVDISKIIENIKKEK